MISAQLGIREAAGIHIHISPDGSYTLSVCRVKAQGKELTIQAQVTSLSTLAELQKHLPAGLPVAVNLSGKGVLIKQTEQLQEIHAGNFSKVLPNANPDDFYIQHFPSGSASFVALMRKAELEQWLTVLEAQQVHPLVVSLGPFVVQQIMPQLNLYGSPVVFDGHQIERNEQQEWTRYRYLPGASAAFPVKAESEKLEEKVVLAYAAAFQLVLARNLPLIEAAVPQTAQRLKAALAGKKLQVWSYGLLAALFVLLLVNFGLFSYYSSANERLSLQAGQSAQTATDVAALAAQIKAKEDLLDTLGWEDGMNKAARLDRIAGLLPSGITWQSAAINPQDRMQKSEQKSARFLWRKIRITGEARRIADVNEWLIRIKLQQGIKDAQLQDYGYNSESDNGQFTVMISY